MTAPAALGEGVRRVNRAPLVLIGMFLVTLLVALPLALALRGMIEAHLGASLAAEAAASGVNMAWWQEFAAQASGLGRTFAPSLIGFGAVLDNLSGLLDNAPLAATIGGATLAWLVLWSFLSGGVLDRYARDRPTRTTGFFAACGTHFWRFLRLGAAGWVVYLLLFGLLHGAIFDTVARASSDLTVERRAFALQAAGYLVFGALMLFWVAVFDFARVRIVVEDRRSALGALLASLRFVRRHRGRVAALYLLNGALFVLLLAVYAATAPGAPRSGAHMVVVVVVGEVYILARHYLKLLFYASEVALFQGTLAHAEYTAPPVVLWPESPAVESVTNPKPVLRG
ncbi:MAG TPA: hypothetical protein VE379_06400 [Vicinamibacterales bacterium]|jgi:hypothetical protein|nr:hypothetical protein [Vicinamibacterales bacterium]